QDQAGAVEVIYGTNSGLSADGSQFWDQDSPGIAEMAQTSDRFGSALIAADFGKDTSSGCYDDLAIGVPNEMLQGTRTGIVHVLYGSATGITATGSQLWSEYSDGLPANIPQGGDQFGRAIAAGNFQANTSSCGQRKIADLVVGAVGAGVAAD